MDILNDNIILKRKKKEEVINMLNYAKYDCIDDDSEFKYLTKLPMDSVTEENVEKILKDRDNKNKEVEILINKTEDIIWLEELIKLREMYLTFKDKIPDFVIFLLLLSVRLTCM